MLLRFKLDEGFTRTPWVKIVTNEGMLFDEVEVMDASGNVRLGTITAVEFRRRQYRRWRVIRRERTERTIRIRYRFVELKASR